MTTPDSETLTRLTALSYVGNALQQRYNDNTQGTDYLIALQELAKFEAGIKNLDLPAPVITGMNNLVTYINSKINKRIQTSEETKINL